jgi:Asp-tRNA(Asn)/Glu-tRNA(Gln) amidotransferase A subunit family amidase
MIYSPSTIAGLSFDSARRSFCKGEDTPRDFLERCIETIERLEPTVKAWASLRFEAARRDADDSNERYRSGAPLSSIDGLPIGIKDLISTADLPTGMGIAGNDGHFTGEDSPSIRALREAGAVIVGKTVTTELGGSWPSATTNPFDSSRTPGGSSSGSAAAVAARMVPVTIGTQVGGSILRPAAYCGNFAIKPTMGAIHRGERLGLSHGCIGVHAASLSDMWTVAAEIASRSGGDPGYPGLFGATTPPAMIHPKKLIVMDGGGWRQTQPATRSLFERVLEALRSQGVQILTRDDDPAIEAFEVSVSDTFRIVGTIVTYENRPLLAHLMNRMADKLSPTAIKQYEAGLKLSLAAYRTALNDREEARDRHRSLARIADAVISLACTGPAPLQNERSGEGIAMPTGNPIYNVVPSILGAPAITLPLLAQDGMPVGLQIMGQWHADEGLTALARGMMHMIEPIGA